MAKLKNLYKKELPADTKYAVNTEHFIILPAPNTVKWLFYFKVLKREDSKKFCRISMTEPKYIGAPDETLILSRKEIQEIIDAVEEPRDKETFNFDYLMAMNNKCVPHAKKRKKAKKYKRAIINPEVIGLQNYPALMYYARENIAYAYEGYDVTTVGRTDKLRITTGPSGIEGFLYFCVRKLGATETEYCRISMTEPAFIGAPDETLKLSREDIQDIITLFQEEAKDCSAKNLGYNNWKSMLLSLNTDMGDGYVSEDLPMPDYSRLYQKEP